MTHPRFLTFALFGGFALVTAACAGATETRTGATGAGLEHVDNEAVKERMGAEFDERGGERGKARGAAARDSASIDVSGMPRALGATVDANSRRVITRLKTSDCIHTTISPLVIGDQIVYATHKPTPRGKYEHCASDDTSTALYAVDVNSGEARVLIDNVDAEGNPVYAEGVILMPLVGGGGGVASWHNGESNTVRPVRVGMDSAALWDPAAGHLVVGTINPPSPMCQKEPNPSCGVLMTLNRDGSIKKKLGRTENFRAWVAAGPTTDGTYYYVGGGSGMDGDVERTDSQACAVAKLDRDLTIVGSYDDGVPGCRDVGRLKSAPIGEIAVTSDSLWAQYLGATVDGTDAVPFVRLNKDTMEPTCRVNIPAPRARSLSGFYTGPVVDERNRAYFVSYTSSGRSLIRVNEDCTHDALYTLPGRGGDATLSSPALADDKYVLTAEAGNLLVINRDSGAVTRYPLGSKSDVTGSPVVHSGGVTVVSEDGTVTTLKNTGLSGYGSAPWPRFRKDNLGGAGSW